MRVALTFDTEPAPAGYSPETAGRIIATLAERGVAATFFLQGEWAEQNRTLAARLTADGHRVGNHTQTHALPGVLAAEELHAEIAHAAEVIERTTGQSPRPYFRCPQSSGAFDDEVLRRIAETGYRQVGWTFDSLDWEEGISAEAIAERVLAGVAEHGEGCVVLLHSWPDATAEALPRIVGELAARGVEFVTLDALDADTLPVACVQPRPAGAVRGRHLAASTLWGLLAKFATVAGNFLIGVVIARALGPEGKGAYALVLQVVGVLVVVLGLGLTTANIYFVASKKLSAGTVTANSLGLSVLTGGLAGVACLLFLAGPLAPDPPYPLLMAGAATALFFATTLFAWLGGVAVGLHGLKPRAIAAMSSVAVVFAGAAALWQAGALSALSMVALGVLGQVVATIVVLAFGGAAIRVLRPSVAALRGMVRYSAKSYVVELVSYIHLRIDIILLGWLTTAATVGIYSVGVSFAEVARYVPGVVGAALFARASQLAGEEGSALSARMSRLTVLLVAASVAVFGVLGPFAIPRIFGVAFSDAALVFLVLLPGVAAISIAEVPGAYLFSRQVIYWKTSALVVVLNVVINLIAIPRLGALGAALASSATYTLLMVIVLALMRRESGLALRELLVPTAADVRSAARAARRLANR